MEKNDLNVLLLEDNPWDARLVFEMFKDCDKLSSRMVHVSRLDEALKIQKEEKFDVILMDLGLPDSHEFEGLDAIIAQNPSIPVIVLTGNDNENVGIQALQKRAADYLVKGKFDSNLLVRTIRYAIERKRVEENLANERHNLQMIFDVVNVGMLLIDEHGTVERVNNVISRWVGKEEMAMCGTQPGNVLGCIHAIHNPKGCGHSAHCQICPIRKAFEDVLRYQKPVHDVEVDTCLVREGKEVHLWIDVSADPLIIDGKKHVILAINNITERKKAEEILKRDKEIFEGLVSERSKELMEAHIQLAQKKRLSDIGTLAATIAHELRNPLAAIGLATYNIKRKAVDAPIEKHIKNIEKKVAESEQIINNLLFYSRIKPPHIETANLYHIIEECVDVIEKQSEKKVLFRRKYDSIKDVVMSIDPLQMKEVFQNILNNAYDAVSDGKGTIEISAEEESGFIKLYFKDNGTGIDKEHFEKVFDPFFTTKAKGTGLGLSVCQQIVNLHGGAIHIESELGQGTTFMIALPKIG
ncbi:MAG: response regulator [Candidatus Omnitrophica bacterium]|nr:response regulator [Candidatus Omnitrophota bacterium]